MPQAISYEVKFNFGPQLWRLSFCFCLSCSFGAVPRQNVTADRVEYIRAIHCKARVLGRERERGEGRLP